MKTYSKPAVVKMGGVSGNTCYLPAIVKTSQSTDRLKSTKVAK